MRLRIAGLGLACFVLGFVGGLSTDKQSRPKTMVIKVPIVSTSTTSITIVPQCFVTINGFKVGMDPLDAFKIGRKCESK